MKTGCDLSLGRKTRRASAETFSLFFFFFFGSTKKRANSKVLPPWEVSLNLKDCLLPSYRRLKRLLCPPCLIITILKGNFQFIVPGSSLSSSIHADVLPQQIQKLCDYSLSHAQISSILHGYVPAHGKKPSFWNKKRKIKSSMVENKSKT